jgi:hypothetical protein
MVDKACRFRQRCGYLCAMDCVNVMHSNGTYSWQSGTSLLRSSVVVQVLVASSTFKVVTSRVERNILIAIQCSIIKY